nr:hypothetical protein GCM10020063_044930 [Dactylosporangium thailandense]
MLDAVRLGPDDDVAEVTAGQVRAVLHRLLDAGHWHDGDPDVLVVFDSGYDLARLAFLLADLPVEVLGRLRADRVLRMPVPPRRPGTMGRPAKHGGEFHLADTGTWPAPGAGDHHRHHPLRHRHRAGVGPVASPADPPGRLAGPRR